jgi:serine O-acetyltransferase
MSLLFFSKDLAAAVKSSSKLSMFKGLIKDHTVHLVFSIRLGQTLSKIPVFGRILSILIEYALRIIFSVDISMRTKIGPGFVIAHGQNIVIGSGAVIGDNCLIFNGVTLGNKDLNVISTGNQPTLNNNVTVCTGAKILGNLIVGEGTVIGANAVVLKDCEPFSVYGGVPARKIR